MYETKTMGKLMKIYGETKKEGITGYMRQAVKLVTRSNALLIYSYLCN